MKKLEVGDYVKNLTEKQFDKIMDFQPGIGHGSYKYDYIIGQTDCLWLNTGIGGSYLSFPHKANRHQLQTELTYRQFLGRAKNTFGV